MTITSVAVKTGIATIALTALGLTAAVPASAHTNNMYTLIAFDEATESTGFATYGKTDGVAAYIGETFEANRAFVAGIELFNEQGLILGSFGDNPFVQTWDHTNGSVGSAVIPFVDDPTAEFEAEINDYIGLDTLNNGTTVTVLYYGKQVEEEGPFVDYMTVASVNAATGALVPLVDITAAISFGNQFAYEPTGIATDPFTGITYVFLQNEDSEPAFLAVDVAGNTVGTPTVFGTASFTAGRIDGVDFDGDGTLYFNYENYPAESLELQKFTARPSEWATANPVYISLAPAQFPDAEIYEQALTTEYVALANTGAELPVLAWLLVGTVAVLAGGVTVTVARRRADAGTV